MKRLDEERTDLTIAAASAVRWMRLGFTLLLVVSFLWVSAAAFPLRAESSSADGFSVIWQEGDTPRGVAERYLGDPDLWPELLRSSGLGSVTELRPGVELWIPATLVSQATLALKRALAAIRAANREGARLFAPVEIARAIELRERALAGRQEAEWEDVILYATAAVEFAEEARARATASRDAEAEAVLSDREGRVEGRRPEEPVWSDRDLHDILVEQENVRTLSRSSAQMTFRDDSRLRLNANSQAVIQRMRVDPLTRREEATVSLVEGDFYAVLGAASARSDFAVDLPEAETEIDSRSFWVRRDVTGAKFTNYDDQILRVSANGATVDLGRNEGAVVRRGGTPSEVLEVLPPPRLMAPGDDAVAFAADVELNWSAVDGAAGYWLEVAGDPAFDRMRLSRWGLLETSYRAERLDVGAHYWRIAALDNFGLPGTRSDIFRFHVRVDHTPPYLAIHEPAANALLREDPVTVRGEADADAAVTVDGVAVAVAPDGRFNFDHAPQAGLNVVVVEARDPAGNVSQRQRSFRFVPDAAVAIRFAPSIPSREPRLFVTGTQTISVAGTGLADALVEVRTPPGDSRARGYSDAGGAFAINVPLGADHETFDLVMTAPTGQALAERFAVVIDREPPPLVLEPLPPAVTAVEWLPLRGRADGARWLEINGRRARLLDGAFDETVTLRPGTTRLELVTADLVGNVELETFNVVLDQTPPEYVRHALSTTRAVPGASVQIDVVARDESGLKKAAPFRLRMGEERLAGFLEYDQAAGRYRGTVTLPAGASGRLALDQLELEDYAGNVTRERF